ncbi:MAG: hypothetical protein JNM68_05075 [Dinghuibacter sp.]|nr:hypothetical protein [Dinghuibacter sp.]
MQVLLEHIIYHNALNKDNPLELVIETRNHCLAVSNTLHPKTVVQAYPAADALENLLQQYEMLGGGTIEITEQKGVCTFLLPLFHANNEKI